MRGEKRQTNLVLDERITLSPKEEWLEQTLLLPLLPLLLRVGLFRQCLSSPRDPEWSSQGSLLPGTLSYGWRNGVMVVVGRGGSSTLYFVRRNYYATAGVPNKAVAGQLKMTALFRAASLENV